MEGLLKEIRLSTESYLKVILEEVCDTYELPKDEVLKKYLSGDHDVVLPTPNRSQKREVVPKPDAKMCKGLTAKGGPCKFVAQEGCDLCGIYLRKSGQSSSKVDEEKVLCKGLTAKGGPCKFVAKAGCEYCGTHLKKMGEPTQPEKEKKKEKEPEKEKEKEKEEKVMSLQERLNKIMADEDEEEEEEEKPFTYADENDIESTPRPTDIIFPEVKASVDELIDPVEKKTKKGELNLKLQAILAEEEDSDVDEEDYVSQMSDTPKSREKLNDILEGI